MVIYTKEHSFKMRLLVAGILALHGILSSCQTLKLQAFVFYKICLLIRSVDLLRGIKMLQGKQSGFLSDVLKQANLVHFVRLLMR